MKEAEKERRRANKGERTKKQKRQQPEGCSCIRVKT
jgi:hypothetical protein